MSYIIQFRGTLAVSAVVAGLVFVLFRADSLLEEDPLVSPLYQAVLDQAYSRFRESDVTVLAHPGRAVQDPVSVDVESGSDQSGRNAPPPPHETPEFKAAEALAAEKKPEEALAAFREILKRNPSGREMNKVRHRVADLLAELDQADAAAKTYREILRLEPNYLCCFEHLSRIYEKQRQPEMAARMLENVEKGYLRMSRMPGAPGIQGRASLASFWIQRNQKLPEALELAKGVLGEKSCNEHLYLLARCYEKNGHVRDALETIDRIDTQENVWKETVDSYRKTLQAL